MRNLINCDHCEKLDVLKCTKCKTTFLIDNEKLRVFLYSKEGILTPVAPENDEVYCPICHNLMLEW